MKKRKRKKKMMMMMMMMMMMSNKTQIIFDIIKAMGNAGVQPRRATDEVVIKRIAARRGNTFRVPAP
jgi:hypothetical protein